MNEHAFKAQLIKDLRKQLPAKAHIQKHCDRFTAGIPDLEVACSGMTSWIELKWLKLPVRSTSNVPLYPREVKPVQKADLMARRAAGQSAYVLLGWEGRGWLVEIARMPESLTKAELEKKANCERVRGKGWQLPAWFYAHL